MRAVGYLKAIKPRYPLFLANKPVETSSTLSVTDKYTLNTVTQVCTADKEIVDKAIQSGYDCEKEMANLASYERKNVLKSIANKLSKRKQELAEILCIEAGKPINDSLTEVSRCIETFEIAAEEATRIYGEYTPLDLNKDSRGFFGVQKRFPIGLISMISPFNFPMNLVAHKVAPAIASGCPFILKPSSQTPVVALILADIISKAGLPEGAFSVLPCDPDSAEQLVTDERIKLFSFTGSADVGWMLRQRCGKKKSVLELGGNAACIVDKNTDLEDVSERILYGAFYQSGQSCISVQRIYAHKEIIEELKTILVKKVKELVKGDPMEETTFIGPLISTQDAERCSKWVNEAVNQGATVLIGGKHKKNLFDATIVENPPEQCDLHTKEVFGPICTLESYEDIKTAVEKVNKSQYGLQAGIFTNDINNAYYAFDNLQVGGVVINDVPNKRIDAMPYGGIKNSGFGKEGVRYSINEMTEMKLMLTRNLNKL